MENLPKTIEAISSLLWPIITIIALWHLRKPITKFVGTWNYRKTTIKIGDKEISVDAYNEQQRDLINDLQDKIIELENKTAESFGGKVVAQLENSAIEVERVQKTNSIIWVDDHPENHAQIIERLKEREFRVDQVTSTEEALTQLSDNNYDLIITDMHRVEYGEVHHEAGLELTKSLKNTGVDVPVILFFGRSKKSVTRFRDSAIEAGVSLITSSPTELISAIEFPEKLQSNSNKTVERNAE